MPSVDLRSHGEKRNIVVIGGSYAGTKAVELIAARMHPTHRTILIEPHSHFHHLYALPRYAVVHGFEHHAFIPYFAMFKSLPPDATEVVQARVTTIHLGFVELDCGEPIPYEYLIIATGTRLVSPGTLDVKGKAEGVAFLQQHQRRVERANKIVVAGGGAVGIQLATDIKDYYPTKSVTLVHSRSRLMHKFHPKLHELISARAEELGIQVVLNKRVLIPADGFPDDGSEFDVELSTDLCLRADMVICASGQTPLSAPLQTLAPGCITPTGFISVKPTLQLADQTYPNVFAIGDVADTQDQKAAKRGVQHAHVVAQNIACLAVEGLDAVLSEYSHVPWMIRMSLGMTRELHFSDPVIDSDEPLWRLSDEGYIGSSSLKVWSSKAPGIKNYFL
ncbi:FAD/NAD-P-binding domain-containing protein [Multifurca ochricompacta]|uniref:FAD/NAD-P-binding domain-containing protein n=1 Tax=Multifurca ochricompacta TaxID=376703 RepID=A0AAD4QKS0_9AGAM|nr:FAD/NAD-P-binding domain-containing protein [Multifurca ochricompacta]